MAQVKTELYKESFFFSTRTFPTQRAALDSENDRLLEKQQ